MSDLISYGGLSPPSVLILLSAIGVWLILWRRRLGFALALIATSLLFLAAIPIIAASMLREVEIDFPAKPDFTAAQAIVVLGAGVHLGDGDDVPDTLGPLSLERVAFGAHAYHQLHLRVAVTGGLAGGAHATEASLMRASLEQDFVVPVTWSEDQSRNTYENALFTARLLKAANLTTVVVVTHAWHMRRALWSFERVGLHALPWPAPRTYPEAARAHDYLPNVGALQSSYYALHEAVGLAYYRLRY
jgi:uncharacterized SAM-binding protein YcdF (DUF218 family)